MPFITVSRMFGSGGSDVAERVARSLGWALLDNDVVDAVAERSGLPRAQVSEQDERVPSLVERLASALSLGSPEMLPPVLTGSVDTTEERIVTVTGRVIEEAMNHGPAVFVGRGAQCLLASREDALHVFCYAPLPVLIDNAINRRGVKPADAERTVHDRNRQREQYVKRHWHRDWRAFENYDLCLNTGTMGIGEAADLVIGVARKRFQLAG
jgi:cytidylate kinase